jgi:hypothetical protein
VHAQTRVTVIAGQVENMSLKRKLHAEYPKAQREWLRRCGTCMRNARISYNRRIGVDGHVNPE